MSYAKVILAYQHADGKIECLSGFADIEQSFQAQPIFGGYGGAYKRILLPGASKVSTQLEWRGTPRATDEEPDPPGFENLRDAFEHRRNVSRKPGED